MPRTNWFDVIRNDLRILANEVHPRINTNQKYLDPQQKFEPDDQRRDIAPYARRVDRFVREVSVLSVAPWLDVEYSDRKGFDNSLVIESFHEQLGNRMRLRRRIAQAHRICVYAPWSFLKIAMPGTAAWQRGFDDVSDVSDPGRDGLAPDEADLIQLDEVPPGSEPSMDLSEIAQLTPDIMKNVKVNDMPSLTAMDTPRIEAVDPRHVVTDPYIGDLSEAYYIAHLFVRSKAQAERAYGVAGLKSFIIKTSDSAIAFAGVNITAFRPITNQELVVLAEIYIRQDPAMPSESGLFGVMDMSNGKWILEPKKLDAPNRWVAIRADDTHPQAWFAPSYIDIAYDDMVDAGWTRKMVRRHMEWTATDALWMPESVGIDDETLEEIESGDIKRRIIRYSGPNFDVQKSSTRQIPVALLQYEQIVDNSFSRNTGATETAQGRGSSNKVATAFNQEAAFMEKRQADIMNKLYDAYIESILIATWLIMNYGSSKFTISANGISFVMDRDTISGIANYSINAVNRSSQDPLAARLMMVQQLKEIFNNPALSQHFDLSEIARMIAALNGWPSRVLASTSDDGQPAVAGPAAPGGSPEISGTSAGPGGGLDSVASTAQSSASATGGTTQRNT